MESPLGLLVRGTRKNQCRLCGSVCVSQNSYLRRIRCYVCETKVNEVQLAQVERSVLPCQCGYPHGYPWFSIGIFKRLSMLARTIRQGNPWCHRQRATNIHKRARISVMAPMIRQG